MLADPVVYIIRIPAPTKKREKIIDYDIITFTYGGYGLYQVAPKRGL